MKAYHSQWNTDHPDHNARTEWLKIDGHHIFKRECRQVPHAKAFGGFRYERDEWRRDTDITETELEKYKAKSRVDIVWLDGMK